MKLSSDHADAEPEINLISLIDVLFCLIIFLVITITSGQHRSAVRLVSAARGRAR